MNEVSFAVPQTFSLYYPDPASAIYTYLIIGFLLVVAEEFIIWRKGLQDIGRDSSESSLSLKVVFATFMPVLWPIIILSNVSKAEFLHERGLYDEYLEELG